MVERKTYTAKRDYTGKYAWNITIELVKGRQYTLPVDQAEWVNRDRPGTLAEYKPRARRKKPAQNRQQTGGQNRATGA